MRIVQAFALLTFIVGTFLFFRPQVQAGIRPSLDVRQWTPVWRHPVYGRKRSLWIGMIMMIVGGGLIDFFH